MDRQATGMSEVTKTKTKAHLWLWTPELPDRNHRKSIRKTNALNEREFAPSSV